jgi:hypothetical protein
MMFLTSWQVFLFAKKENINGSDGCFGKGSRDRGKGFTGLFSGNPPFFHAIGSTAFTSKLLFNVENSIMCKRLIFEN